jgi:N-methylhydantoinase A/oxoprolinase/acetone carboxylase beta subunit
MKIGIGIDTGGTYTDAVLYDFDSQAILAHAKALTTKEDLAQGIGAALDALPKDLLPGAELVSLSTTLATNACVEEKGGRARLVMIGMDEKIIRDVGESYGLSDAADVFLLPSEILASGEITQDADWDYFARSLKEEFADCDAVGIVALHATLNNAVQEKKAREIAASVLDIPVICGHELFSDINCVQRGASILLNARLVPVIAEFLSSVKTALTARDIHAPAVIVRSDGSLMSKAFAGARPVETLLCGPAASVTGGISLTNKEDAVIVDMGGTTTDIALVSGGEPVLVEGGIRIGKWKTFVKGLFIDTFGLGGDTAVHYKNGKLKLDTQRVMPLCIAASRYPAILAALRSLVETKKCHNRFLHEFYVLQKDILKSANYDERETAFCRALLGGPLILSEAAKAAGQDVYTFSMPRLEREGVVVRAGLTPTDIMHIKGDFSAYDKEASLLGAQFVALNTHMTPEELCDQVYLKVKLRLYTNIVRILLQHRYPRLEKHGLSRDLERLIAQSYVSPEGGLVNFGFKTPATLVGIGAPIHIFLPDVARALQTACAVPKYAEVANALGAIVGKVSAKCEIEVKPEITSDGKTIYTVLGKTENRAFADREEAESAAAREAEDCAAAEAQLRGAFDALSVRSSIHPDIAETTAGTIYLGTRVVATAAGRISLPRT